MNAQEALAYIEPRLKEWCDYRESHSDVWFENKCGQDYEALLAIKQLIDKANSKPKTLEELGWVRGLCFKDVKLFFRQGLTVYFSVFENKIELIINGQDRVVLTNEELIAIAEKMKELGMDQ